MWELKILVSLKNKQLLNDDGGRDDSKDREEKWGQQAGLERDGEEEKQQGRAVGVSHPSLKFRSLIYLQRAGTALQLVMWNQYLIKAARGRLIGTDLPLGEV